MHNMYCQYISLVNSQVYDTHSIKIWWLGGLVHVKVLPFGKANMVWRFHRNGADISPNPGGHGGEVKQQRSLIPQSACDASHYHIDYTIDDPNAMGEVWESITTPEKPN